MTAEACFFLHDWDLALFLSGSRDCLRYLEDTCDVDPPTLSTPPFTLRVHPHSLDSRNSPLDRVQVSNSLLIHPPLWPGSLLLKHTHSYITPWLKNRARQNYPRAKIPQNYAPREKRLSPVNTGEVWIKSLFVTRTAAGTAPWFC